MKKITLISVHQTVAIIDYTHYELIQNGKLMNTNDILELVQKITPLPKYDKAITDAWKRTITLVSFVDKLTVIEE